VDSHSSVSDLDMEISLIPCPATY